MVTKPSLIILEGNISAGKTTLVRDLGKLLDYTIFLEPTYTNPYLEKFYAEPTKYALIMQIWLLKQRFRIYIAAIKHVLENKKGVILDRSVFSDWVFAERNRLDKNISEEGFKEYLEIRDKLLSHLPTPQVTVYLDVSPSECHRRVHSLRGRDCESGIPLAYLTGLDDCYHSFLNNMERGGSRILTIPWNSFGNSNNVAQQIRAICGSIAPLEEVVDVEKLTNYIYQNPDVLQIVDQTEHNESNNKEHEFLAREAVASTSLPLPTPTPALVSISSPTKAHPQSPSHSITIPINNKNNNSPVKITTPTSSPSKFSPRSNNVSPVTPPLLAN